MKFGENQAVEIPSLRHWIYLFTDAAHETAEKGVVLGIDHAKFQNLIDANGKPIPQDKAYHIYNAFIDFHSFCNVFAVSTPAGGGIQDLQQMGQKIVHAAAFSEPPVNVGSVVSEGSFFKNGEITLQLKGVGLVKGKTCALVEFDSGVSSFNMIVNPMPDMEVRTVGSSHYMGDIYIDLNTNWVQKVDLDEFIIRKVTLSMPPNILNTVVERHILIRNVNEKEFK